MMHFQRSVSFDSDISMICHILSHCHSKNGTTLLLESDLIIWNVCNKSSHLQVICPYIVGSHICCPIHCWHGTIYSIGK